MRVGVMVAYKPHKLLVSFKAKPAPMILNLGRKTGNSLLKLLGTSSNLSYSILDDKICVPSYGPVAQLVRASDC